MRAASALLSAAVVAATWSCAGSAIPRATQVDLLTARKANPDATLADLDRGRSLYLSKCAGCHQLVKPHSLSPEQWPSEVADMRDRAKLQQQDVELIVLYLVTMASAPAG